jgi:5-methyltetrahydropteroyltriglutamate--homocysteine methyltransferase
MIYNCDRILTTHAGSLPRPEGLLDLVLAKARGEPIDQAALDRRLASAVTEVVKQQIECGIDVINDGEFS